MNHRRQEKLGWTLGWSGGFIWVLILSIVFFVQGRTGPAWIGLALVCCAGAVIVLFSPWRHPQVRYRLLMAPIYLMFFLSLAWGIWLMEDPRSMGLNNRWSALMLLPVLIPLWTAGSRRWQDRNK